ncbi:Ltp family lipoprotein [Brevundimonas bacteroides]|uniref:Ltp family lipoprotein n=1 Tax=Brevundimonas bacteroides TaxID=74311 RepID=UPI000A0093EC|nr:Ltp family lipoprotein [Brevundimonas bacteroides]
MTRPGLIAAAVLAGAAMLASCGAEGPSTEATSASGPAEAASPPEPEGPRLTGPQRNAVRSAEQYLSMTGFSRAGLIAQLSSDYGDRYSVEDATVAVDSLDADWNENAARSAAQYLSMSGFSCAGLIDQLSSSAGDRYTPEQARYGAEKAGAC